MNKKFKCFICFLIIGLGIISLPGNPILGIILIIFGVVPLEKGWFN